MVARQSAGAHGGSLYGQGSTPTPSPHLLDYVTVLVGLA